MYDKVLQLSLTVFNERKLNTHNHSLESSSEMARLPFLNFICCARWKSLCVCAVCLCAVNCMCMCVIVCVCVCEHVCMLAMYVNCVGALFSYVCDQTLFQLSFVCFPLCCATCYPLGCISC